MFSQETIDKAVQKAEANQSKLNGQILHMRGYSGKKFRHFLNNLCEGPNINYFEVGSWFGSTIISASYNNEGKFTCNDNFSQFGGILHKLEENRSRLGGRFDIIVKDSNLLGPDDLSKDINIYFYDGAHGYDDHKNALKIVWQNLADQFIFIIDDWNGEVAREATKEAVSVPELTIEYFTNIITNEEGETWWNGMGVYLLRKNNI